jgi:hypothetical protein
MISIKNKMLKNFLTVFSIKLICEVSLSNISTILKIIDGLAPPLLRNFYFMDFWLLEECGTYYLFTE